MYEIKLTEENQRIYEKGILSLESLNYILRLKQFTYFFLEVY